MACAFAQARARGSTKRAQLGGRVPRTVWRGGSLVGHVTVECEGPALPAKFLALGPGEGRRRKRLRNDRIFNSSAQVNNDKNWAYTLSLDYLKSRA